MVRRGEIWWYAPPDTRPRPHLVIARDSVIPYLYDILAIPATRTRRGIPTEIELGIQDGMPADCVLTTDNLTLVTVAHLRDRITKLSTERMAAVCAAVGISTGC